MKPFIDGCELPMPAEWHPAPPRQVTYQGRVVDAMSGGEWFTRKEIEQATGLDTDTVNTVLQHSIRRGVMERELPLLRGCTKAVTQRYRLRGRA